MTELRQCVSSRVSAKKAANLLGVGPKQDVNLLLCYQSQVWRLFLTFTWMSTMLIKIASDLH